jgi:hypothetical protein
VITEACSQLSVQLCLHVLSSSFSLNKDIVRNKNYLLPPIRPLKAIDVLEQRAQVLGLL